MISKIYRNEKGFRIRETHHRSKYSDETVERARVLREERDLTYKQIGDILGVHWRTVCDWCEYRTRAQ